MKTQRLEEKDRDPICPECERPSSDLGHGERQIGFPVREPYTWTAYHPECALSARAHAVAGLCSVCHRIVRQFGELQVRTREPGGEWRLAHAECLKKEVRPD